jgi:hypothetical protein
MSCASSGERELPCELSQVAGGMTRDCHNTGCGRAMDHEQCAFLDETTKLANKNAVVQLGPGVRDEEPHHALVDERRSIAFPVLLETMSDRWTEEFIIREEWSKAGSVDHEAHGLCLESFGDPFQIGLGFAVEELACR